MQTSVISTRPVITTILILQLIPLVLFPPASFVPTSQEWWLPMLLMICALVAVVQIVVRKSDAIGPWDLLGFVHGFNIISRLMLVMPRAIMNVNGQQIFDTFYVVLSIVSMLLSAAILWYIGLPSVRAGLLRD